MNTRLTLIMAMILCFAITVGAGCSTKSGSSVPPGATEVKVEDDTPDVQPEPEPPMVEEDQYDQAAIREAKKQEAVEELEFMIHFAFDSYELSEQARDLLAIKARLMKEYPGMTMVIEGYCDERGTEEYNLALGEKRARAAFEHLVILGVEPERLSIVSFGEERPIDPGHNETAWAKNRRDEFKISY